jgi:hypothetical protein
MSMIACPKCGEFNESNTLHCTACGARLDEQAAPVPDSGRGTLIKENLFNLLGLVAGVTLVLLGIFVPALGSAIIQFILLFTESNRYSRRAIGDAQPNNSDGWIVIVVGVLFILASNFGLYASLKKFWAKRFDGADDQK